MSQWEDQRWLGGWRCEQRRLHSVHQEKCCDRYLQSKNFSPDGDRVLPDPLASRPKWPREGASSGSSRLQCSVLCSVRKEHAQVAETNSNWWGQSASTSENWHPGWVPTSFFLGPSPQCCLPSCCSVERAHLCSALLGGN